ncbi:MAG: MarR family winged helix-turn-helix transcriptional regulator [Lautropia sp.]
MKTRTRSETRTRTESVSAVDAAGDAAAAGDVIRFYRGDTWSRENSIGWLMKQAITCISRELHDRMAAVGVTAAQWPLLLLLESTPGATAAELARALSMDAGAMTRMLDRLIDKGLIDRTRCDADRRATRLSLTAEGHRAACPLHQVLADTLNDTLRGFSRDEFQTLQQLLRRLLANAKALPSAAPAGAPLPHEPNRSEPNRSEPNRSESNRSESNR